MVPPFVPPFVPPSCRRLKASLDSEFAGGNFTPTFSGKRGQTSTDVDNSHLSRKRGPLQGATRAPGCAVIGRLSVDSSESARQYQTGSTSNLSPVRIVR